MSTQPPTKTQIRAWDTTPLGEQAAEWGRAAQAVNDQHAAVSRQLADSPGIWRGDAADAMRAKGDQARGSLSTVSGALDHAKTATTGIAQSLSTAKTAAVDAIDAAERERFMVGENGTVAFDRDMLLWVAMENQTTWTLANSMLQQIAGQHEDAIKSALRNAGDAAEAARGALEQAFAEVPLPPEAELEGILNEYQVQSDPGGMVTWPDEGLLGFLGKSTDQAKDVTAAEAEMLDQLSLGDKVRFYEMMTEAEDTALGMYPGDVQQDDHTDAFRHVYWNAMMTQEFGEDWTNEYTSKHEGRDDNKAVREAMDLHNNEIGRTIALQNPDASREELKDLAEQAVARGDAVLINQEQSLSWTNTVDFGQTVNSTALDDQGIHLPGSPVPDDNPSPQ